MRLQSPLAIRNIGDCAGASISRPERRMPLGCSFGPQHFVALDLYPEGKRLAVTVPTEQCLEMQRSRALNSPPLKSRVARATVVTAMHELLGPLQIDNPSPGNVVRSVVLARYNLDLAAETEMPSAWAISIVDRSSE